MPGHFCPVAGLKSASRRSETQAKPLGGLALSTLLRRAVVAGSLGVACVSATAQAASEGGLTFRLSVSPDIANGDDATDETRTEVTGTGAAATTETRDTDSKTEASSTTSMLDFGVGYTFSFGLHLGGSMWQETSNLTLKTTSKDDDETRASTYEVKSKSTLTAFGPTVGYIHPSGFTALLTPFLSVSQKTEETAEFSSGDDDVDALLAEDEPTVTNDSKTTGFRLDLAYHFRMGPFGIGPELSYTSLTTKVDVTTVEKDTTYRGEPETTTTRTTGTSTVTRIAPMIGMSLFL
jgi:hypothetical protein